MTNIGIINTFSHTKSTGKIVYGLYNHLKSSYNCSLFYGEPHEEKVDDENIICINNVLDKKLHIYGSLLFGNQGEYSWHRTKWLIRELKRRRIECIFLFNIHGYYLNTELLFDYLAQNDIKVIYVMLDEFAFCGKCCFTMECEKYKTECKKCPNIKDYPKSFFVDRSSHLFNKKRKYYSKVKDIVFVSIPYIVDKAKTSSLLKNHRFVKLEEGIDIWKTYYPKKTDNLAKSLNISKNKIVLLLVAPFSYKRKGAEYFLELANMFKHDDRYVFINVGFDVDKNICPNNFVPISYISNQSELAEYYSLADYFVCTSFAETVADTCLESLACGTPVIGFAAAGLPYSIKEKHCKLVQPGNVVELANTVLDIGKKNNTISESCRKYAEDNFDSINYYKGLENLIH